MIYGATNAFTRVQYDLISRLLVIIVLAAWEASAAVVAGIMMVTIEDLVSVVWDRCGRILRSSSSWCRTVASSPGLFGKQTVRVA